MNRVLRYAVAALSALVLTACSRGLVAPEVALEPAAAQTLRVRVAQPQDDAQEARGTAQLRTPTLAFSKDTVVGLRFQNVAIPQGARITRAHVEFRAASASSGPLTVQLRGVPVSSADPFAAGAGNLSRRQATSASAVWRPNAWRRHQTTRTADLSAVVQEIVNRSGWRPGNALALTATAEGGAVRHARAFSGDRAQAPVLVVTFEAGASEATSGISTSSSPSTSSTQVWHERLLATINTPDYNGHNAWMNPVAQASSGDTYVYARNFNHYMTSLILAYRETGDRKLVQQMDSLMNRAKGKLRDTNGDGYKNWRYLTRTDSSSAPFIGKDTHEMDEMMTHAMVAAVAYTFKQAGYDSSARYWTDYLKNDFEAKWRKRKGKTSGFPFLTKELTHAYVQWIRYHHYMGKLTGDSSYASEARRMASIVRRHMDTVSTPSGTGYTWNHRINDGRNLSRLGCQHTVYVRLTTQALADLATQDAGLFDHTFMARVSNTVAHRVLKRADGSKLSSTVCGNGTYGGLSVFANYPYAQLAPWDSSGRLKAAAERVYNATERHRVAAPRSYNLPATMVFTLSR